MHVAAAVSLSEAMTTAVDLWRRETGEAVSLNFAASNVLSRQIEAGAPADLFISADAAQMDRLVARGAIDARSVVPLLTNQLVVIAAPDRPVTGPMPAALADPRVVRIALGEWSAVPAGVYARLARADRSVAPGGSQGRAHRQRPRCDGRRRGGQRRYRRRLPHGRHRP
jgi:molybdate transport system substrate-binding protein